MKQRHWVNIVLVLFLAWAVTITGVTFYASKASYIERMEREASKTCKNIARREVPCRR